MGTRAATGGCVVGIDAEPGLHHQGAVWRVVLALIIWGQRRPLGTRSHQHPSRWRHAAHSRLSFLISTHTSANSALLGMGERELFTRALAAGLAVTGSFPGGPQVKRASDAEGLIGGQALDLPCLHAALAGARTLGRPQLSNQTSAVLQAPPAPQASSEEEELGGLSWSIMNPHAEGPTSPPIN